MIRSLIRAVFTAWLTFSSLLLVAAESSKKSPPPVGYSPDYAQDRILTPPVRPQPRINGARVFGARPGAPFLFKVAATGEKPLRYAAANLPEGLRLDPATGIIKGAVSQVGEYKVRVTVTNDRGSAVRELRFVIGEEICLTPPMGWNSWYRWSESIGQQQIRETAEAMVQSGLADHGWTYVNIDDCWQGQRGGRYQALQGNERFPDIKALCDQVHALGLKVGIYSTPWIGSYAGFPGGSCLNAQGTYDAEALPLEKRLQPAQLFGRFPGARKLGLNREGPHWFCNADAKQWAEWGIDYVKYDWLPNDVPTTQRLAAGLRASGRDIVLSLSNNAPIAHAAGLSELANLWRTTGDIQETWASIKRIGFSQGAWAQYARPGHWNDPDMLQVGMIGTPNQLNRAAHRTRLSPDEQYTQVSLWSLLSAPLLLSCDLGQMDAFTFSLLSNDEVIEVDQDPRGIPAARLAVQDREIWVKPLEDGSLAVGLFNLDDTEKSVDVLATELKLSGRFSVRDLWRQQDLGAFSDRFSASVRPHGVMLVRVQPMR